jgi:predicted transcriptional regulator
MSDSATKSKFIELTADIVSAFVSHNSLPLSDLPALIETVNAKLEAIAGGAVAAPVAEPLNPPVSIKKSITPDYLICLEDGKRFKSLKRHLRTDFNMTPEAYRTKWGLPHDYPMVAPNYAKARSALAKTMGLGQNRVGAAAAPKAPRDPSVPARPRGRPRKAA